MSVIKEKYIDKDAAKRELLNIANGNANYRSQYRSFEKQNKEASKTDLRMTSATPLPGIYPKASKSIYHRDMHTYPYLLLHCSQQLSHGTNWGAIRDSGV